MNQGIVVSRVHLPNGRLVDIELSAGRIVTIAEAGSLSGRQQFDGGGGLCVRPLSDSHIHLDKAGTVRPDTRPPDTIAEAIASMRVIKREAKRDPQQVTDRMVATLQRLAGNGTRYVRALVDVDEKWGLTGFEAALDARRRIGPVMTVRIVAFAQEGMSDGVADMLSDAASRGADVIGGHTDVGDDARKHVRTAAAIARRFDLPLEVHVDEPASAESFKLPVVLEESEGVRDLALVHCLSLSCLPDGEQDRWIGAIRAANACVVVATSVVLFGLPLAPIRKLLDAGIPIVVGSDNLQDVFVPLGTGRLLENVRTAATVAGLNRFEWMETLFDGATGFGYRLVTGEPQGIEEGSSASFTVFSGPSPTAVLFGDDTIQMTFIDGELREGRRQ